MLLLNKLSELKLKNNIIEDVLKCLIFEMLVVYLNDNYDMVLK